MVKSLNRKGTYRTYSIADGLAGMRIEHIAEDSEGYLWFATYGTTVLVASMETSFRILPNRMVLWMTAFILFYGTSREAVVVRYIKWCLLV